MMAIQTALECRISFVWDATGVASCTRRRFVAQFVNLTPAQFLLIETIRV